MYRFFKNTAVCIFVVISLALLGNSRVFAEGDLNDKMQNINMSGMEAGINIGEALNAGQEVHVSQYGAEYTDIWLEGTYLYEEAWQILELVNKERAKIGVPEVTMDKDLLYAAMTRAIETQIDFSHTRPNGESCFSISSKVFGENIAAGNSTAEGTMRQWMNSPGHKANILDKDFSIMGVGCFTQGGIRYWVQLFGNSEAVPTDERQNIDTQEAVQVITDNIQCQMNVGDPYRLARGEKENYDGKFVLLNNGWNIAVTWILPSTIEWSSSNTKIFQVDTLGHLTGIKVGSGTLSAKLKARPEIQGTLGINVYDPYGLENVKNLKAAASGKNKVFLSWQTAGNAEGYLIYAQKNGKYGYVGMTTKGITFTDTKALDTDYNYYWVFPYVTDQNTGKIIPGPCEKYVYAKGIIPSVQNLKASSVKGGVKLTWTEQKDAEGYLVYGQRAGGKYGYVGMTTKGTTFTDTKASKTAYNYYWAFPYHKDNQGNMIVGGTPKYTYGRAL